MRGTSRNPKTAKDHAKFDRFCGSNSPSIVRDCYEIASNSGLFNKPIVANAHAVIEQSMCDNLSILAMPCSAIASNTVVLRKRRFAQDQTIFVKCYASKEPRVLFDGSAIEDISSSFMMPSVENAQSMFDRFWEVNSDFFLIASAAIASNSCAL